MKMQQHMHQLDIYHIQKKLNYRDYMHALILYIGTALSSTLFTKPSTPMKAWPGACSLPEKMRMRIRC